MTGKAAGMNSHHKENEKISLLVIVGPTAVGKTKLSIELAQLLGGEIVSADSVQVYRYLDIGSAKPSLKERNIVAHHMIDIVEPDVNFTVYDYQKKAAEVINDIHKRGMLPLLVGGTGLYIKALLDQYNFSGVKVNPRVRRRLEEKIRDNGNEHMYDILRNIDLSAAEKIHPNDSKRITRALEFYYQTGEPISRQWERTKEKVSPYDPTIIGLTMERNKLYTQIDKRVEKMIEKGLHEEVKELLKKGYHSGLKSLQALGYKQMFEYLQGKRSWEEAIALFKRDTRRYAKRQLTWFKADPRVYWLKIEPAMDLKPLLDNICMRVKGY